jgi:hypothetical protein
MASRARTRVLIDHDEIRRWTEERGAKPAHVVGTGDKDDIGILRLEFPGAPGAKDESLDPISWDDWFHKFDERRLALLVQDETARGQKSNFNKIISRDTAEALGEGGTKAIRSAPGSRQAASSKKSSTRRASASSRASFSSKKTAGRGREQDRSHRRAA